MGKGLYSSGVLNPILIPSFTDKYLKSLETQQIIERKFNSEVEKVFDKIPDEKLKQQVIEYNNETKSQDDLDFTKYIETGQEKMEQIIQLTAESLAIAKYKVVQLANYTYSISSKDIPNGIITTYGLIKWGTFTSLYTILYQSYIGDLNLMKLSWKSTDWSDKKNLDIYYKSLTTFLNNILQVIL